MITVEELDEKFGIEGELGFTEIDGDLIAISVYNKYADTEICLYGGHVTRFIPHNTFDVLWLSPQSYFEIGKPIRGGIPVCFPWFGPHATDSTKPLHGFVRLMYWDVVETKSIETGETLVKLQLSSSIETKKYWPFDFYAVLTFVIGRKLEVTLTVTNTGNQAIEYSAAFHSYFSVSDIGNIQIHGLEGTSYYQGSGNELSEQTSEFLSITQEENRRYIDTEKRCAIIDTAFSRFTTVEKEGSKVTVIWNPGEETAANIEDIPNESFCEFVCVETVNAYDNTIKLVPGEQHTTSTIIGVEHKLGGFGLGNSETGFSVI